MISVEELFKDSQYPLWITSHNAFKKIPNIRKVFPSIGLLNFEADGSLIDNSNNIYYAALNLISTIGLIIEDRYLHIAAFLKKGIIGKKRRAQIEASHNALISLKQIISKRNIIIKKDNGTIALKLSDDISYQDKILFRKGESLFSIYNSLSISLSELKLVTLQPLEQILAFKAFSAINIPSKKAKIIFSSDGKDGIWDIATMSMRGIRSCQTWTGNNDVGMSLIGSIIDPFTAIMYLTSGEKTTYGSKMIQRCVIRYIYRYNEPCLLIEKMYPAFDAATLATFKKLLEGKSKLKVFTYHGDLGYNLSLSPTFHIPLSDELKTIDPYYYPYRDSKISFRETPSCQFSKIRPEKKISNNYEQKLAKFFKKCINSHALAQKAILPFGLKVAQLIKKLRTPTNSLLLEDLSYKFATYITSKSNLPTSPEIKNYKKFGLEFFNETWRLNSNQLFNSYINNKLFDLINKND